MVSLARADNGRARTRDGRAEFNVYFAVTFTVLLVVCTVCRLLPRRWRPFAGGGATRRSIVGEALAATSMIVPFAFMG